jgi:hypothetical protein
VLEFLERVARFFENAFDSFVVETLATKSTILQFSKHVSSADATFSWILEVTIAIEKLYCNVTRTFLFKLVAHSVDSKKHYF